MATSIEKQVVVKSTNAYGFRIEGSDDYYDYSKQSEVERATKGATVRVKVSPKDDGKWWVNQLEVVDGAAASNGHANGYQPTEHTEDRSRSIIRQTCLKAAAEFLGRLSQTREDVKSEHVMVLAERFEAWVNR